MTTKDFLRKREFYLPFFEYLVRDFPDAPLYDVIANMDDGSSRHFYTFSRCPNLSNYKSIFISRVTKGIFDAFKSRFLSFYMSCSKCQRDSLIQYYSSELHFDECSDTASAFNIIRNYLEFNLPINES